MTASLRASSLEDVPGALLSVGNKRAPAGTGSCGGGTWQEVARGGDKAARGNCRKAGTSGEEDSMVPKTVVVLTGSPRLTAFQTVPAMVSCLPDRALRAGYASRVAHGEREARRRGGGRGTGRGSPPRGALALPAVSVPSAPCSLALSPAVRGSGGAKPLLWHFWSVTVPRK